MSRKPFCSSFKGVDLRISLKPIIPLRGVRNSWLMLARNKLFAWLAFFASSMLFKSSSFNLLNSHSACFFSVISFPYSMIFLTFPLSSLTGKAESSVQRHSPVSEKLFTTSVSTLPDARHLTDGHSGQGVCRL